MKYSNCHEHRRAVLEQLADSKNWSAADDADTVCQGRWDWIGDGEISDIAKEALKAPEFDEEINSKPEMMLHDFTCLQCGGVHAELKCFRYKSHHPEGYPYWTLCPVNGEPILAVGFLDVGTPSQPSQ